MLLGQGLHSLLGCEHDHLPPTVSATADARDGDDSSPHLTANVEHVHDAETCPLCQFQAQGQLVSAQAGSELRQVVTSTLPFHAPLVLAFRAPGVHGPRPPPGV
jgi:hypothetical protein